MDKGPWTVVAGDITGKIRIDSDDFTHDASLIVYGDFANDDDRIKYARFIADKLNSLAEKDAALCRAREWMKTVWSKDSVPSTPPDLDRSFPCPHEARVKELEEQVRMRYEVLTALEKDITEVKDLIRNCIERIQ